MGNRATTEGLEWLQYSFTAFNGSGYADRSSSKAFVDSYIDYSDWKHRQKGSELAKEYYGVLLELADHLIKNSKGAGITPTDKNMAKFKASRNISLFD